MSEKDCIFYMRVINFSEKITWFYRRLMQFTATDSHLSAYTSVLEHTSHAAFKDSFSIWSSSVIQPSIKGNAGPIASVFDIFYDIYSTTSQ